MLALGNTCRSGAICLPRKRFLNQAWLEELVEIARIACGLQQIQVR
jgi:hypothetical protein